MILSGNIYSIGTFGWSDPDLSLPDSITVGTYGWHTELYTLINSSGLTEDPSFDYIYVHPYASGKSNGLCWYDAFNTISEALDALESGAIFHKTIDLLKYNGTGYLYLSGMITKVAIALGTYNEDLIYYNEYYDPDEAYDITLEGGFDPGWPLISGHLDIVSSGYSIINSVGTGFYGYGNLEYNNDLKNLKFVSGNYGIYNQSSAINLNNIIVSGCNNPIYINDSNYEFRNINIYTSGVTISKAINIINSTGNIFSTSVNSGCGYGIYIESGEIGNFYYNKLSQNGTGLYVHTPNQTITMKYNLFDNNYKPFYITNSKYNSDHNTCYGISGITLIESTGYYNNGIIYSLSGYQFENISGQLLINNGCLYTPTYSTGHYYSIGTLMFSGDILYDDPKFALLESGDYRLDITSRCINKAEIINESVYERYPLRAENIRISDDYGFKNIKEYKDKVKILDNSVVYINPMTGCIDENVTVTVNELKTIVGEIEGVSSFDIDSGLPDKFPYDYKIISRFNYKKNNYEYFLVPYTIFEIRNFLNTYVSNPDKILQYLNKDNIEVKTKYNLSNMVYDNQHGYDSYTNEVFYTIEKNNQYLIKSDTMKGYELKRYYLMCPESSGIAYKSYVYPSGLSRHQELMDGYEFQTEYFQDKNKVIKPGYITCINKEGAIKWLPTDLDRGASSGIVYRDIRGLVGYDSNLYYLVIESTDDKNKYERELHAGNCTQLIKINPDNEIDLEKITSGQLLDMLNPAGMTINKNNNLVIANYDTDASGNYYIKEYKFCYDYAMIDKNVDNTNRIYFRESYPLGVII